MPLTVTEALKLEIFNKCKLLTGQAGLQNEILWVNILEILDDLRHIEPGEFLITTAHDFSTQTESKQQAMIELFAARKLAAMAIQTGHYLQEIPGSFIRFAEEHNIPLIEIPPEVSFKSLTRALMNELLHSDQLTPGGQNQIEKSSSIEKDLTARKELWQQMLETKNPEDIYLDLERYNIGYRDPFLVIALALERVEKNSAEQSADSSPVLLKQAENAIAKTLLQQKLSFLLGPSKTFLPLLIQSKDLTLAHSEADTNISQKLLNELQQMFPSWAIWIGCSSVRKSMGEIRQALHEAEKALLTAQLGLLNNTNLVSFRKMGLYRIILDLKNVDTLKGIFHDTTAPLLDYDLRSMGALMETLSVYLQSSSAMCAAKALFVHRHTMKYRLEQIEKLTGLNPLVPADALQLNLGLHVYNYLKASNLLI